MNQAIIIPTWKRLQKLQACLKSLEQQEVFPDLVVITVREEDQDSISYLQQWEKQTPLTHRILKVNKPGVIYAENSAISYILNNFSADIISFMDDDAIALPDWVKKIKSFFSNHAEASALGGPDMIVSQPETYHDIFSKRVGELTFFGKVIGNHHHKSSGLRTVDALKGVNMSVRRNFLKLLDTNLQGEDPAKGNGVFWELELCLYINKKKGKIYFDPNLLIHHDSNHSHFIQNSVTSSTSHNLTYVLMSYLSWPRKIIFLLYSFIVGNGHIKGIVKTLVEIFRQRKIAPLMDFYFSMKGLMNGLITWIKR